jgi:hypothetical protein
LGERVGCDGMKGRLHNQPRETVEASIVEPCNEQVLMEVQSFLQALASYPDRFAKEPKISFEQHLGSLVAASQSEFRRRN